METVTASGTRSLHVMSTWVESQARIPLSHSLQGAYWECAVGLPLWMRGAFSGTCASSDCLVLWPRQLGVECEGTTTGLQFRCRCPPGRVWEENRIFNPRARRSYWLLNDDDFGCVHGHIGVTSLGEKCICTLLWDSIAPCYEHFG
jgi:hypothetical protein